MKYRTTFWSLMILGLCGCSKPTHLPADISQRLSTADHIVVTNHSRAFGTDVLGAEVGSLAKAVASAKQDRFPASAMFDWDIEFYTGTNFLTVIHLQDRVFMLGDTQYSDDTGVLKTFWQKLVAEDRERRAQ
jgi:hypothetical protein